MRKDGHCQGFPVRSGTRRTRFIGGVPIEHNIHYYVYHALYQDTSHSAHA